MHIKRHVFLLSGHLMVEEAKEKLNIYGNASMVFVKNCT